MKAWPPPPLLLLPIAAAQQQQQGGGLPPPCDKGAMAAAIERVSAACGVSASAAGAARPLTECPPACAAPFVEFMDTYNHGACMPAVQWLAGSALRLGDLESSCREMASSDGGADASAVACSSTAAMPMVMACSRETAADQAFCLSPCHALLAPFAAECASMMPGWLSQMLAPALAAVQACADASAEDTCDMMLLMPTCQAEPPGDTLDCQNPCLLQLFACQGNPMLPMIFGEDVAGRVPGIQAMCVAPEGATGAGDGICDVQKLMACSHGPGGAWSELEAECGPEDNRDVRCTCANACVIEYIECIDVSTATVCPTISPAVV